MAWCIYMQNKQLYMHLLKPSGEPMPAPIEVTRPADSRQEFYDRIGRDNMRPLWELLRGMVTNQPRTHALPALWKSAEYTAALFEAGNLITAEEAERRVLVLENPGLVGQSRITQSLYAGVQLVLAGEQAPSHRHTQTALRFVLQGAGAHTTVDGREIHMAQGDLVITPNWAWHEHVNTTDKPMIWLDGLDVPLITMLDASFAEEHPTRLGKQANPNDKRYSRLCHYPYKAMRHQLEAAKLMSEADPRFGWAIRYRDPADGADPMPTMGTWLQLMEAGFRSTDYRSTDGKICVAVSGRGETKVGEVTLAWEQGDVFVIPAWTRHHHVVREEAVLFSFSDRPVQEKLGVWREDRLD
jgi:gentisate 1,2-dioxygenase